MPLKESDENKARCDEAPTSGDILRSKVRTAPGVISRVLDTLQSDSNAGDLYLTLRPSVVRIARYLLKRTPSDELVHDVCVDAALSAHRFRGECAFSSWLHIIVERHVRKWNRSEYRRRNLIQEFGVQAPANFTMSPDNSVIARMTVIRLNDAMARLSRRQRMCIILVQVEELSVQEVANRLGVTPDAVRMNIHRARARIRKWFVESTLPRE